MTSQIAPYFARKKNGQQEKCRRVKKHAQQFVWWIFIDFYCKPSMYYSKCLFLDKTGMNKTEKTTNLPFKKFPFYGEELHCRKISRGRLGWWVGERAQWEKGLAAQAQGREFKPPQLTWKLGMVGCSLYQKQAISWTCWPNGKFQLQWETLSHG